MKKEQFKKFVSRNPFEAYCYGVAPLFAIGRKGNALDLFTQWLNDPLSRDKIKLHFNESGDQIINVTTND